MSTGEMTNDLLINFHRALLAILEALKAIQLDRRSEEWDELSDQLCEVLVLRPLKDFAQLRINLQYGAWPRTVECANGIGVELKSSEALGWIGTVRKWEEDGIGREIEWTKQGLAYPGLQFLFREFNHPEMSDSATEALDFVVGELIEGTRDLPPRSRICVRLADCRFFLWQKGLGKNADTPSF